MNNKNLKYITSVFIGFIFFIAILNTKALYVSSLIRVLNCDQFFIQNSLDNLSIPYLSNYYHRFSYIVYLLIFNIKIINFLFVTLIVLTCNFIYKKKIIKKELLFTSLITLIFLFLLELGLNLVDYKKIIGLKFHGREIGSDLELKQLLAVDEVGINYFLKDTEEYINKYKINNEGFRSLYNYDEETIQLIKDTSMLIMFVGDSHTEGCCAEPIDKSFVDLVNLKKGLTAINFGIGGTDPLQYKLIVDKYLEKIKPDILIIPFCLGNDFMYKNRKPNNSLPLHFQTNFNWLDARYPRSHPNFYPDTYFKNWEEARAFYIETYTTDRLNSNFFTKNIISKSNLLSFIYLIPKTLKKSFLILKNSTINASISTESYDSISYNYIKDIQNKANQEGVRFILMGVPTIRDMDMNIEKVNMEYKAYFNDIIIHIPENVNKQDFVSYDNDHFLNSGHQKFADFIDSVIVK